MDKRKNRYFGLILVIAVVGYFVHAVRAQTPLELRPVLPRQTDTSQQDQSSVSSPHYFLKIDGIPGESNDDKHKGEIDILSFQWGETQAGSVQISDSLGSGKVTMQDFQFTMKYNKASPKLFLGCANGEHFPKAVLTLRKAGANQLEYLKWMLSDVMCKSYQTAGTNPSVPTDQFSLNFSKIEVEYTPQKSDGKLDTPVKAGWDLKANKAI